MNLTKREIRQRTSQLRDVLNEWDPLGIDPGSAGPLDEYDCLLWPLLALLQSGASEADIAKHLESALTGHFGLDFRHETCVDLSRRIRAWFDLAWRDPAEPVTIYVALLNEGVDCWRPVAARPLGAGLYRIIGVEDDASDETWQFPAGSLVRCEPRTFQGGEQGMTAVAPATVIA